METQFKTEPKTVTEKAEALAELIKQHCMVSLQIASNNTSVSIKKVGYDVEVLKECADILEVSFHEPSSTICVIRSWLMYKCGDISVTVYSK